MLKEERQRHILDLLRQTGKVLASEVSRELLVSEDTVRRDLQELDQEGKLHRVHGGALPRTADASRYSIRKEQAIEAKAAIGRAAAQLVQNGQTVFMDGGTTTLQVARSLASNLQATIITNSPPIAIELAEHPSVDVVLIGGRLMKEGQVVVGSEAMEQIRLYRTDLLFLGTCAIHAEVGLSVPHAEEAPVKRAMLAAAAQTVGLATADKLDTTAPCIVGPVSALAYLVVNGEADEEVLVRYRRLDVTVIQAK